MRNNFSTLGVSIALFLLLAGGSSAAFCQPEEEFFELIKEGDSIMIWERWITHNENPVRELMADFTIKGGTSDKVRALIKDEEKGLLWNNKTISYQVPEELASDSCWLVYIHYNVPWPIDDYDCALQYHFKEGGTVSDTTVLTVQSAHSDLYPPSPKLNRITGMRGVWTLVPTGDDLRVNYMVATDRSGKIPRWISDPLIRDNLFRTLQRFRDLLEAEDMAD